MSKLTQAKLERLRQLTKLATPGAREIECASAIPAGRVYALNDGGGEQEHILSFSDYRRAADLDLFVELDRETVSALLEAVEDCERWKDNYYDAQAALDSIYYDS